MANQSSRCEQQLGFAPQRGFQAVDDDLVEMIGGGCRDRTDDPLLAKQVLSQLS